MRVAIIHYWLVNMRGGEKVIESLCRLYPEADIFTHVVDREIVGPVIGNHTIHTTSIAKLPGAVKRYQSYLPLMPSALEKLNLSDYDLVISSESGPAKGVIAPPTALHICYTHSPMRYLWDQYETYRNGAGRLARLAMPIFAPGLRRWDVTSAARVDAFVANSSHVAKRIDKYWRRDCDIIYPPVFTNDFSPVAPDAVGDFYLWVGELASYKRPDLLVEAFDQNGKRLIVIGGPDSASQALAKTAKANITFLGKTPFDVLKDHMARCRALVFPGEEDFGIVPVEVMASGRPVIALRRGGALDTVADGVSGLFFDAPTPASLNDAIERFERDMLPNLDVDAITAHADTFSESVFHNRFSNLVSRELASRAERFRPRPIERVG